LNSTFSRLKTNYLQEELDALIITKPSNRRYLSGFTGSSGYLLLTEREDILVTDFRYAEQAAAQAQKFRVVRQGLEHMQTLRELIDCYGLKKVGIEKEVTTLSSFEEYQKSIPGAVFVPVSDPVAAWRRIKSAEEIGLIRKAIEIADRTFLHLKGFVTAGQTEKEVALEIEFFMRRLGSERNAFEIIVASGGRSSLPHGTATDKVIARGELVTVDFGAVYSGYRSDITRTLVMGPPDERQKSIYELVLRAQKAAVESIKPGLKSSEVDMVARSIISEAGYGSNFGHGLGHGLGLDIHEGPRLSPLDETMLEPGMVVTVEPGLYLPGWGGVRIEDVVAVTPQGCEVLTRSPKNLDDMIIDS
jgi:Xaa-Pro aminopeptidase